MSRISKRPKSPKMPDMVALKRSLTFDPETGKFFWIEGSHIRLRRGGKEAGSLLVDGEWWITFRRVKYKARRLAWYFVTGQDPGPAEVKARGFSYQPKFSDLFLKEPKK